MALRLVNEGKHQMRSSCFDTAIRPVFEVLFCLSSQGKTRYIQLGKYKEAIVTLDRYREHAPDDIEAILLEGWCYLKMYNTSEAEQFARKALNLEENNTTALNLMGSVAAAEEDYFAARDFYETAIQLDKTYYEAHLNLASVLFNVGNYTKCIQAVEEFLDRFPSDRELMYLKAQSLSKQGKNKQAIGVYEQILNKNTSNDFVTMTYIAIRI